MKDMETPKYSAVTEGMGANVYWKTAEAALRQTSKKSAIQA
jgi:hypothetical protein